MRASTGRCIAIGTALAGLVTSALSSPAHAFYYSDTSVPLPSGRVVDNDAGVGLLSGWGAAESLPESLQGVPVVSISLGSGWALASTITGNVVTWGADSTIARALPSSLDPTTLAQLSAAGTGAAAALSWDGHVTTWFGGDTSAAHAWLDTGALTGIRAIAVGQQQPYGVALTKDGTVRTWGVDSGSGNVTSPVPGTLTGVVDIAACDDSALALTADGGVHGWGSDTGGLVSSAPNPDANKVVQIACAGNTGIALRKDGTVSEWGDTSGVNAIPGSLRTAIAGGAKVTSIDASTGGIVARGLAADFRPQVWAWGGPTLAGASVPSELSGEVSEFASGSDGVYALTPAVLVVEKPVITGTAVPGKKLTAQFGTFTGHAAVVHQWYRDGIRIEGSASTETTGVYQVKAGDVGHVLTYRSTATDSDHPAAAPAVAESDPITVGRAASTLTVTPRRGSYGRSSTVAVHVASPAVANGRVNLSVDGNSAGTAALVHGTATFRLPAKLSAGFHMVGATYGGNSVSGGASGWATLNIAKATSHTKVRLPKKGRKGSEVKAIVKVRASGVRATGTVTVRIGDVEGFGSVIDGKAVVKLKVARSPHRQKVVAIYSGDNNVRGSRGHARL